MAYFDSAKNRALWQDELEKLTAERERRKSGSAAAKAGEGRRTLSETGTPAVRRITFAELLEEHRKAIGKETVHSRSRSRERSAEKELAPAVLSQKGKKSL